MDLPAPRYAATHEKPHGPGDARPTALQIVRDEQRENGLVGKVILITGCSSGIGIETARALKSTGATLFLTARNLEKARVALGDITDGDRVHLLHLNLESLASVRACAAEFRQKSQALHVLINNAGVRHVPEGKTEDGFETHFAVNHLAHFLLFELLRPVLIASSTSSFQSRVVAVASTAHRQDPLRLDDLGWTKRAYDPSGAYGQSKLANVYMANEIERRYGAQGLHAWSVHPGGIRTGLGGQGLSLDSLKIVIQSGPMNTLMVMQSPEQGAATTAWAAVSRELEGKGGRYLERCQVSEPLVRKGFKPISPGHAAWAYDEEAARNLYELSSEMTGLAT